MSPRWLSVFRAAARLFEHQYGRPQLAACRAMADPSAPDQCEALIAALLVILIVFLLCGCRAAADRFTAKSLAAEANACFSARVDANVACQQAKCDGKLSPSACEKACPMPPVAPGRCALLNNCSTGHWNAAMGCVAKCQHAADRGSCMSSCVSPFGAYCAKLHPSLVA